MTRVTAQPRSNRKTREAPTPLYDLFSQPAQGTVTARDLPFELLKFWIQEPSDQSIEDVYGAFSFKNGLSLTVAERKTVLAKAGVLSVRTLMEGGIIRDERVLNYPDFETYARAVKNQHQESRHIAQKRWIGTSVARKIWVEAPAKKASIRLSHDIKDAAIAVVDEYYTDFTEASVRKAMIQIRERDYGGDKRIGVMVKAEPYASQFTLQVRGMIGPHNVANEGNGWTLEMEKGSALFSIKKRYTQLPTRQELIDDLCVWDWLETLPAKATLHTDTETYPVYPTAKDVFETGYEVRQTGQQPYRVEPVSEVSAKMGFHSFLQLVIGLGKQPSTLGLRQTA